MASAPRYGPYETEELLGKGGMGAVYRAVDTRSGARVALKVVLSEHSQDERMLERFRREGRLGMAVRHKNVVSLLDAGDAQGVLYLAFELVPGGSLGARLKQGKIPWREAARLGAGIARGLAAIHGAGLVHRDLKPDNVLVDAEGRPRIADLGLARQVSDQSALTRTSEMVGTLEYMSPEQADGARAVDYHADLYSLGATLYALVTGAPPFGGAGVELVKKHLLAQAAPLRSAVPGVPPALDALVLRLLSKDPREREPGATEVAKELEEIAAGKAAGGRSPAWVVVSFVGVAALGALGFVVLRPARTPPAPPPPPPRIAPVASTSENLPSGLVRSSDREFRNTKDGSVLVRVEGRTFTMGRLEGASSRGHLVTVDTFYIGKCEVSNEQFGRYADAVKLVTAAESRGTGSHEEYDKEVDQFVPSRIDGASWRYPFGPGGPPAKKDEPVVQITWEEARDYCAWAGLVLPSEAQWELAAGGDTRTFPWGEGADDARANTKTATRWKLMPVGSFPDGAAPCGALDMAGNVFEWCWDLAAPYKATGARTNPLGPSESELASLAQRVVRGGSWNRRLETNGEVYMRNRQPTTTQLGCDDLGFRVALDFDPRRTKRKK